MDLFSPNVGKVTECANSSKGDYYASDNEGAYASDNEKVVNAADSYEDDEPYNAEEELEEEVDYEQSNKKANTKLGPSIFKVAKASAAKATETEPVVMSQKDMMQAFMAYIRNNMAVPSPIATKDAKWVILSCSLSLSEMATLANASTGDQFNAVKLTIQNDQFITEHAALPVRAVTLVEATNKHAVSLGGRMPQLKAGAIEPTTYADTGKYLIQMNAGGTKTINTRAYESVGNSLRTTLLEKYPGINADEVIKRDCLKAHNGKMTVAANSPVMEGVRAHIERLREEAKEKGEAYKIGDPVLNAEDNYYSMPSQVCTAGANFIKSVLNNTDGFNLATDLYVVINRIHSSNETTKDTKSIQARNHWMDTIEVRANLKDKQVIQSEYDKQRLVSVTALIHFGTK